MIASAGRDFVHIFSMQMTHYVKYITEPYPVQLQSCG